MALLLHYYKMLGGKKMTTCIVYVLFGGLTFATTGCHSQMFHGDGVITPHEVIYTSHIDPCYHGYGSYVDRHRIRFNRHTHHKKYHYVYRNHRHRVKYNNRVRHHRSKRFVNNRHRVLKKRTVRRHYNKKGQLRKRVTTRRYRNNRY